MPRQNQTQEVGSKKWIFTLNNPNVGDHLKYINCADVASYCFQDEVGEENGTPHYQGTISFKNRKRLTWLKRLCPRSSWRKCKDWDASIRYCSNPAKRSPGGSLWENCLPEEIIDFLKGKDLYPWQQYVLTYLSQPRDPRQLVWIWDPTGATGKTMLVRHLLITQKPCSATLVTGKSADAKYALSIMKEVPKAVLVSYVRSQEAYISYQMLEEVKDGMFFSPKYESTMKIYNPPHMIVFANFRPNTSKLSMDRWLIWRINEAKELVNDEAVNFP